MYFSATLISALLAVVSATPLEPRQSDYQIEGFTGTSCTGDGNHFFGADLVANKGCVDFGINFDSMSLVNDGGGCSTHIFSGSGCTGGDNFLNLGNGECAGFSDGSPVKSITVVC